MDQMGGDMAEPIGFSNANDPRSRNLRRRNSGSPGGPVEGTGTEVSGTDAGPITSIRPFTDFDRERSTYVRLKPELLARAPGQFVVIVGDDCEGPLESFGDAERAGYRRFGLGPLYIKQVLAEEPVQEVSRDLISCRP
jgi:hypothetical protein